MNKKKKQQTTNTCAAKIIYISLSILLPFIHLHYAICFTIFFFSSSSVTLSFSINFHQINCMHCTPRHCRTTFAQLKKKSCQRKLNSFNSLWLAFTFLLVLPNSMHLTLLFINIICWRCEKWRDKSIQTHFMGKESCFFLSFVEKWAFEIRRRTKRKDKTKELLQKREKKTSKEISLKYMLCISDDSFWEKAVFR